MFIALHHQYLCAPAERYVLWRVRLHAAPDGAGYIDIWSYKHVAPPEQEPLCIDDDHFSGTLFELSGLELIAEGLVVPGLK